MVGPKNFLGAEIVFGRVEKVIWPPNTITRRRRKKKKSRGFSAWAPKNTTLGRLRSKGLEGLNGSRCRSRDHTPVQFTRILCGSEANGDGFSLPELGRSDTRMRS